MVRSWGSFSRSHDGDCCPNFPRWRATFFLTQKTKHKGYFAWGGGVLIIGSLQKIKINSWQTCRVLTPKLLDQSRLSLTQIVDVIYGGAISGPHNGDWVSEGWKGLPAWSWWLGVAKLPPKACPQNEWVAWKENLLGSPVWITSNIKLISSFKFRFEAC